MQLETTDPKSLLVTIDMIWQCNGRLLSSARDQDGRLKDICLSYALYRNIPAEDMEVCLRWATFQRSSTTRRIAVFTKHSYRPALKQRFVMFRLRSAGSRFQTHCRALNLLPPSADSDLRPSDLSKMSEAEIQAELMKRHSGPSMGFVKLRLGILWTPDMVAEIAMKWTKVLRTGAIRARFMGVDRSTIMFTMERGQDTAKEVVSLSKRN
nr:hypothetical protein CFP56_43013 [Quercus suber]